MGRSQAAPRLAQLEDVSAHQRLNRPRVRPEVGRYILEGQAGAEQHAGSLDGLRAGHDAPPSQPPGRSKNSFMRLASDHQRDRHHPTVFATDGVLLQDPC